MTPFEINSIDEISPDHLAVLAQCGTEHVLLVGAEFAAGSIRGIARRALLAIGEVNELKAENDRLKADLGQCQHEVERRGALGRADEARAEKAEAALARVEALANEMAGFCCDAGADWANDLRAALRGDQ